MQLNVPDSVRATCTCTCTTAATDFKVCKIKPGVDGSIVFTVEDEHGNVAVGEVPRPLLPNATAAAATAAAASDSEGRERPRILVDCDGLVVHHDAVADACGLAS